MAYSPLLRSGLCFIVTGTNYSPTPELPSCTKRIIRNNSHGLQTATQVPKIHVILSSPAKSEDAVCRVTKWSAPLHFRTRTRTCFWASLLQSTVKSITPQALLQIAPHLSHCISIRVFYHCMRVSRQVVFHSTAQIGPKTP